jgi:hypothetical protein
MDQQVDPNQAGSLADFQWPSRRESSVVSAAPSRAEAPQKAISTSALKTTVEAVKIDKEVEVKEYEDLMAWLKKRKKTAKN